MLCTVALARRFAPLARQRALAPLAGSLGIEVDEVHRALRRRPHLRADLLRAVPEAVRQRRHGGGRPRRCCAAPPRAQDRAGERDPAGRERPDLIELPDDPGVYIFRDERGRPLYVGKSVSLRSRARAHFCAPAGWTERAAIVDYQPTNSELGALVLENRLIKEWSPPGNVKLKHTDGYVYLRCRLDIPYPVLEVATEPAPGLAVNVGPLGGRARRSELADQLTSLYRLRHCGRKLKRARAPLGVRADGPLRVALPRRPRPERLPSPARHGARPLRRARRRATR